MRGLLAESDRVVTDSVTFPASLGYTRAVAAPVLRIMVVDDNPIIRDSVNAAARQVAHHVLVRVWRDRAYSDRALDAALGRARLADRDRALATELVYGTLRHQIHLDFLLGQVSSRALSHLAVGVLAALRLGA